MPIAHPSLLDLEADDDNKFMSKALDQAQRGLHKKEVPIGAIIVDPEKNIIAKAHNLTEAKKCQLAHAEALVIQKACKKIGGWRLDGHILYVTLEPCLMCYGLIRLSRISRLVYAAPSALFGYRREILGPDVYPGAILVNSGLKQDASLAMLKRFFKNARTRNDKEDEGINI